MPICWNAVEKRLRFEKSATCLDAVGLKLSQIMLGQISAMGLKNVIVPIDRWAEIRLRARRRCVAGANRAFCPACGTGSRAAQAQAGFSEIEPGVQASVI